MKSILILIVLTILFLSSFLFLLIKGVLEKRKRIIYSAIIPLVISVGFGGFTGYKVMKSSYTKIKSNTALDCFTKVKEVFKSRNGEDIYRDMFGDSPNTCTKVLNYQDIQVPTMDYAIVLKLETCSEELDRILSQYDYSHEKLITCDWDGKINCGVKLDWLNPKAMGDTILVFEFTDKENLYSRTFWTSLDSTNVYYRYVII